MEACGGTHFLGWEIGKLGHEVRLIPPAYVKPFVKRQKNDLADAEAICEAAMRPAMRFVPVKSEETQGAAMVFWVRELLIRQRTQAINALRGHLSEFGQIVPQGASNATRLIAIVEDPESDLPADAIPTLKASIAALTHLEAEIRKLDTEIAHRAKENDVARRLMTVPGIGPLIATAIAVLAPPSETFRKARDFAAWLGLVPRQHSTGGKQRLGATLPGSGHEPRPALLAVRARQPVSGPKAALGLRTSPSAICQTDDMAAKKPQNGPPTIRPTATEAIKPPSPRSRLPKRRNGISDHMVIFCLRGISRAASYNHLVTTGPQMPR